MFYSLNSDPEAMEAEKNGHGILCLGTGHFSYLRFIPCSPFTTLHPSNENRKRDQIMKSMKHILGFTEHPASASCGQCSWPLSPLNQGDLNKTLSTAVSHFGVLDQVYLVRGGQLEEMSIFLR